MGIKPLFDEIGHKIIIQNGNNKINNQNNKDKNINNNIMHNDIKKENKIEDTQKINNKGKKKSCC